MDTIRARYGTANEWFIAAAVRFAALYVGYPVIREPLTRSAPTAVGRATAIATMPASVPGRAIAVPILLLVGGKEIRLGDSEVTIAALLGRTRKPGRRKSIVEGTG